MRGKKPKKGALLNDREPYSLASYRRSTGGAPGPGLSEYTVRGREDVSGRSWSGARSGGGPGPGNDQPMMERYQRHLYQFRKKNGKPLDRPSTIAWWPSGSSSSGSRGKSHPLQSGQRTRTAEIEKRLPKHVLTAHEAEQSSRCPTWASPWVCATGPSSKTFYSTGMRRMELANLKLYDLDTERGTVMIRQGKGKKDRMIPIGERALAWVGKYLADARPKLVQEPDDGTLFLTNLGEAFTPNRLTQMVREYVDAANLGKKGVLPPLPPHHGHAHAGERRGCPLHPGDAGPCRAFHDADLHPSLDQEAQGGAHEDPPRSGPGAKGKARA